MDIIDYSFLCLKGDGMNRDCLGMSGHSAWVMDGAMDGTLELSETPGLLPAYLSFMHKSLYQELAVASVDKTLPQILADSIEAARVSFQAAVEFVPPYQHPSAALALIRFNATSLECLCLGDTAILIKQENDLWIVNDQRLEELDRQVAERMKQLCREKQISVLAARELVLNQIRANRSKQNTPFGYPTCGFEPGAALAALYRTFPLTEGTEILLLSDGFAQIYSVFGIVEPEELFAYKNRFTEAAELLCAAQDADAECNRFPRLRKRDDASALYLEIGNF